MHGSRRPVPGSKPLSSHEEAENNSTIFSHLLNTSVCVYMSLMEKTIDRPQHIIHRLPHASIAVSTPNTIHHSHLTVYLPDSLDLDPCLRILFWLSVCE